MMRSIHLAAFVFAICLTGCPKPPPSGPRDAGVNSRAYVGDAELQVRYRFESLPDKQLVLFVDTIASRGRAGAVRHTLRLNGFTLVRGEQEWTAEVEPARTHTHEVLLKAADRQPSVTVVTQHVERDVQLATDDIRFFVNDDARVAECEPTVDVCK